MFGDNYVFIDGRFYLTTKPDFGSHRTDLIL